MGLLIEDGAGQGGYTAGVTQKNRLQVEAETNLRGFFRSRDEALLFNTVSIDSGADAGDFILYFQNTSTTRDFYVDLLRVGAANASLWKVHEVTGTASGSSLTPYNLNLKSGVTAEATAVGNGAITGLTSAGVIAVKRIAASTDGDIPFDDVLILGTNDAIAVEYDTGTTGIAEVLLRGFYEVR